MTAELPHQSTGITYIGRSARQKHNFYQPMKSYAQISGEQSGWLGRNFSASGQQPQVPPRRGQYVRTRPPETVRTSAVEKRNYYGPLHDMSQDSQYNITRKVTSPTDEQTSPKKQRQHGDFNVQSDSSAVIDRIETENVIDLDRQSHMGSTNDLSETLSNVHQILDIERENQTGPDGSVNGPGYA